MIMHEQSTGARILEPGSPRDPCVHGVVRDEGRLALLA